MNTLLRPSTIASLSTIALFASTGCPSCDSSSEDGDPFIVTTLADVVDSADDEVSLREAVTSALEADGATVTFADDLEGVIALDSPLQVEGGKDLIVQGPMDRTISLSGGKAHPIVIIDGVESTFANLSFVDGAAPDVSLDAGGAIAIGAGKLDISSCVFTNNTHSYANSGGGGAIASEGDAAITITDSSFNGNTSTTRGGAIWSVGSGKLTVSSSTFEQNGPVSQEEVWGGAIYHSAGDLEVSDSTFDGNSATRGAIALEMNGGNASISTSAFRNHEGANIGAALFAQRGSNGSEALTVRVEESSFEKNSTVGGSGGGAIASLGADVTLEVVSSTFSENVNQGDGSSGGAIYATSSLQVEDSSFTKNTALTGSGGAIGFGGLSADVSFSLVKGTFSENQALYGGAISTSTGGVTIAEASFTNNSALTDNGEGGALLLGSASTIMLTKLTLTGNSAGRRGGAIRVSADASLAECTLSQNTALDGGAISQADGNTLTIGAGTSITGNSATRMPYNPDTQKIGGGVCNDGEVVLSGGTVSGNSPDDFCSPDRVK